MLSIEERFNIQRHLEGERTRHLVSSYKNQDDLARYQREAAIINSNRLPKRQIKNQRLVAIRKVMNSQLPMRQYDNSIASLEQKLETAFVNEDALKNLGESLNPAANDVKAEQFIKFKIIKDLSQMVQSCINFVRGGAGSTNLLVDIAQQATEFFAYYNNYGSGVRQDVDFKLEMDQMLVNVDDGLTKVLQLVEGAPDKYDFYYVK